MAHYLDFVGLNTFIYEPIGYDPDNQTVGTNSGRESVSSPSYGFGFVDLNHIGTRLVNLSLRDGIQQFKNYNFPYDLPTTASFFPALMLKRNGPYGYPTWKQIRLSENPLSRRQRKENIFTFVKEPGEEFVFNNNGRLNTQRSRYGAIQKYTESPVSSRYKPFIVGGASIVDDGTLERFEIVGSYGNETLFFNNDEINKYYNLRHLRSHQYETVKDFYLNGGLDKDGSPLDSFEFFKYRECVYPPRIYQYKNYVRQRTTFSFPWRDNREDRESSSDDNGFWTDSTALYESIWPLDAYTSWDYRFLNTTPDDERWDDWYGRPAAITTDSFVNYGILQNQYSFGVYDLESYLGFGASGLDAVLKIGPQYNRKHTLTISSSVVAPNGMNIEGINSGTSHGDLILAHIPSGEAKWEAGSQSGLNPFYDSYDKYIQGVKQAGKEYSIIPEFKISEHVDTYQDKGLTEDVENLFSLTGALSNTTDSSKDNFYTIYSTSEFMKHFEVVKEDHKEFVPASSISLKCKAIKKFLPYEGFYPAQRSVDLAKQFYQSYGEFIAVSGASNPYGVSGDAKYLFQNLMVPTFAPGIFFNTIKSGVAVDYPIITSSLDISTNVTSSGDDYYIIATPSTEPTFNKRIPFEALVEPEKHLAGFEIYCNEPHIYANNSGSVNWTGEGNNRFKLMSNNFLAEVADFFMEKKTFTTISSRPSSDPNTGLAKNGKTYTMRVRMFKSKDEATLPYVSSSGGFYTPPQYPSSSRETFTMYSRPTAFGPPQYLTGAEGLLTYDVPLADQGENYPFTPPYYYGEAWADISFTPSSTKKYSINEIIQQASVTYHRYSSADTTFDEASKRVYIKDNAMHLGSSVNLFSQLDYTEEQIAEGSQVVQDSTDNPSRWVIQAKFETPMLNFNHLSASDSITLPNNASQSVPRGMWHQYGLIEEDPTKGVFLQVTDIPDAWIANVLEEDPGDYESLTDLCGFSTEAKRLGEIADEKKISEAVVAVPFIEEEGQRKFFRIPRIDIERAFGSSVNRAMVGDSVLKMVSKMQNYVFPPPMDFINNTNIDPFAMYIFEFSHTLKNKISQTFGRTYIQR